MSDAKMTLSKAMRILLRHAERDCAGVGRGIRGIPTDGERRELREAAARIWKQAYGYAPSTDEVELRFS